MHGSLHACSSLVLWADSKRTVHDVNRHFFALLVSERLKIMNKFFYIHQSLVLRIVQKKNGTKEKRLVGCILLRNAVA